MAGGASNIRVAALLKRAVSELDLRLIGGAIDAKEIIEVELCDRRSRMDRLARQNRASTARLWDC